MGGNTNLRWFIVGPSVYGSLYPYISSRQIQNRNHILRLNNMQMLQGDLFDPIDCIQLSIQLTKFVTLPHCSVWTAPAAVVQQCIVALPASSHGLSKPSIEEFGAGSRWFLKPQLEGLYNDRDWKIPRKRSFSRPASTLPTGYELDIFRSNDHWWKPSTGTSAESHAKKPPSEHAPATYQLTWDFYKVACMAATQSILQFHHSKLRFSRSFLWSSLLFWVFKEKVPAASHWGRSATAMVQHLTIFTIVGRGISRYLRWMFRPTWKVIAINSHRFLATSSHGTNAVGIYNDSKILWKLVQASDFTPTFSK